MRCDAMMQNKVLIVFYSSYNFMVSIVFLLISRLLFCISAHVMFITMCGFSKQSRKNNNNNETNRPTRSKMHFLLGCVLPYLHCCFYLPTWLCLTVSITFECCAVPYHYRNTFLINSESTFSSASLFCIVFLFYASTSSHTLNRLPGNRLLVLPVFFSHLQPLQFCC